MNEPLRISYVTNFNALLLTFVFNFQRVLFVDKDIKFCFEKKINTKSKGRAYFVYIKVSNKVNYQMKGREKENYTRL